MSAGRLGLWFLLKTVLWLARVGLGVAQPSHRFAALALLGARRPLSCNPNANFGNFGVPRHMATPTASGGMPDLSLGAKANPADVVYEKLFADDEEIEDDGLTGDQLFSNKGPAKPALTYGDIILLPGHINFGVDAVQTKTKLSKNIELHVPFVSSPMDTVTESEMAIQMALHGGIGFIHYNNTIKEQRKQVERVKNFKNGFITNPKVLSPQHKIEDVLEIKHKYGFSGIPITENGLMGGKLVGIVTNRDTDFIKDPEALLADVMTCLKDLVTAPESASLEEANAILVSAKKGKLPVINDVTTQAIPTTT